VSESVQPYASRSIEFPAEAMNDIERAAHSFGLKPASYLWLLHATRSGSVDPSMLHSVGEIVTKDREILKELAK
jgi:hypothetical protein